MNKYNLYIYDLSSFAGLDNSSIAFVVKTAVMQNSEGVVRSGLGRLAKQAGLSIVTVRKVLADLSDRKIIMILDGRVTAFKYNQGFINFYKKPKTNKVDKNDIKDVILHYEKCFKTEIMVLTRTRVNKIKKRIESFGVEEVKKAITNFSLDSFYSGDNERKWKANLDFIIRNDEQIEKGLLLKPKEKILSPYEQRQIIQAKRREMEKVWSAN